jgi:hypothetical protein
VWGSEFTSKGARLQGGMIVVLRPLFAAALVVRRRCFIAAPRPFPAAPLIVRRRCLIVVPMPMPEAPRMNLIVMYRPLPAAPSLGASQLLRPASTRPRSYGLRNRSWHYEPQAQTEC